MHGLQALSVTCDVLQVDPVTSDVLLQPVNISNFQLQSLVFEDGHFWNKFLYKILSTNSGNLKADTNDTRGGVTWKLGNNHLLMWHSKRGCNWPPVPLWQLCAASR